MESKKVKNENDGKRKFHSERAECTVNCFGRTFLLAHFVLFIEKASTVGKIMITYKNNLTGKPFEIPTMIIKLTYGVRFRPSHKE